MGGKTFLSLFAFLLFSAATCWGGDTSTTHNQGLAIHTWGGGELLQKVFQSISMLIYGNSTNGLDRTFSSILRIGMTIGGVSCICLAFFREKIEPLIKNFFLPGIFIMGCLLVPRTTVYIQDHLAQKTPSTEAISFLTVEDVPYFLGELASLISTVSYKLTDSLEHVAHGVNDKLYDWTGHIYAGENIFLTKKCRIANPIVEDNFREFCRECVFRDLGLGIYSKEELIHSKDVLEFLQDHTSKIRTVQYRELQDKDFIPCRDAIKKMCALFGKQSGNTKELLIGETGNDFHYLLNQKATGEKDLRNLIKQQIATSILKEEIPGTLNSFAAKRAELLQKENQKILGALGANSIVAMRNFFEATIYMVFPLIVVVSLLSFGLKPLLNWVHFILWVNTWPPFYTVVKFLLNSIWEFRTKHIFGNDFGLTIFTSEGLADLYGSMESIAAIAMAFIPFLSWILLKGGISQMVQLASSIMAPAQSASATAAAEKTYGNYNFGNVNLDNLNGYNAQTFRQTYSGFLSTGSVGIDSGTETLSYAARTDDLYIKQSDSYLREGISRTKAFGNAVQESLTTSQSALKENSKGFSENLSDTTNKTVGYIEALSKQFQKGNNYTTQSMTGLQEAVQSIKGMGEDYAKSAGITNDQAMREMVSAGLGLSFGIKGSMDANYQDGVSKSASDSRLAKAFDSESFQKHLQTIANASSGEIGSLLRGEDARLHDDFTQSFNKTQTSSEQLRAAYTENEALSNLQSVSNSENVSFHQNLNQRFVDFLYQKHKDPGKVNELLEMPAESPGKDTLMKEFVGDLLPKDTLDKVKDDINNSYKHYSTEVEQIRPDTFEQARPAFIQEKEAKLGHRFGEMEQSVGTLKEKIETQSDERIESIQTDKTHIGQQYDARKQSAEKETNRAIGKHFLDKASSVMAAEIIYKKLFGSEETSKE